MASAGFCDVAVHRIAHAEPPSTVVTMWELGRSMAPLVLLRKALGEETWARLGVAVCGQLVECFGPEPEPITLTANVGVGTR
jgi:hypothetical protein